MSILLDEFEFGYNGIILKMKSNKNSEVSIPNGLDKIVVEVFEPYNCQLKSFNYLTNARFMRCKRDVSNEAPYIFYDTRGAMIKITGDPKVNITEQQPLLNTVNDIILNQMVIYATMPLNLSRIFQVMLFIIPIENGNFDEFTNKAKQFLENKHTNIALKALNNLNRKSMEFTDIDQVELFSDFEITVFTTVYNEVQDIKLPFCLLNKMEAVKHQQIPYTMLTVVRITNTIKDGVFNLILPIQYDYTE